MIPLQAGSVLIADIGAPRPDQIDRDWMWRRLAQLRRFNGDPDALSVLEHLRLCRALAVQLNAPFSVIQWAWRHDCHEAFLGDIIAPVKAWLRSDRLVALEAAWDRAICVAEDVPVPDMAVRQAVHRIDLMARGIELKRLGRRADPDTPPMPDWIDVEDAWARARGRIAA